VKIRLKPATLLVPQLLLWLLVSLPTAAFSSGSGPPLPDLSSLSTAELEMRLRTNDATLEQLARLSLRSGIGTIGYRSVAQADAAHLEWVEVSLDGEHAIDEIVLVPNISRNRENAFTADGFPAEFRIVIGTSADRIGRVATDGRILGHFLPRIAPLVVPIRGANASWVRIEATRLSRRAVDHRYSFQLAEVLIFSGPENVALRRPVKASSNGRALAGAWDAQFLVDGHTPYLMDSASGNQSVAFVSRAGEKPVLEIDLEEQVVLSRIQLHTIDQSDTVPQAYTGDLGMPRHLRIEGSSRADFSDARLLLDYRRQGINDTGPIMMWRIPATACRYVRISDAASDPSRESDPDRFTIGFAEIELFSGGINVAQGKRAKSSLDPRQTTRPVAALTDGNNYFGGILPIRIWMKQLNQRHELETMRPVIAAELSHRYAQQKTNLRRMSWLAALLATGILLTLLAARQLRKRDALRMREQLAADLHDELGADLHTIGLLSDLAKEAIDSREELIDLLDQVRVFTERSGNAARHCTNILEARGLCEDLVEEMNRTSARLLADLEHHADYEGEEVLKTLTPRRRIDIFLFYKECLTNILRHSGATAISTRLKVTGDRIQLIVSENGRGLPGGPESKSIPPSLKRRARILQGTVAVGQPEGGGTSICLSVKLRKFSLFP
jgi:signal transduction histidine kinase